MSNIDENEKKILDFWKKDKTFEKSLKKTAKGKPYIFYDGPPFATGLPHYGHILASVLKDVFPRYFTMNGRYVKRVWGWDCHGLPIENIAEKELKMKGKDEIEKMGVKEFNAFCRSKVLTYVEDWGKVVDRIARWVDFKNSYKTMDNDYIESVWWAFKKLYDKGYVYEGEKILMYCPRCSTPLAKAEVAMDNSYKKVKDDSVTLKFKTKETINEEPVYALAWTTTPWTLPSNLALAVNPKLEYAYLKDNSDGTIYILAKSLVKSFFKSEKDYKILKIVHGSALEEIEYEPIFNYFAGNKNSFKIILGDFVTAEDGTGIVHIAPAFGEDDYAVCQKYKIPSVQPVDEKGKFTKDVPDFIGRYIFDTNKDIIELLKKQGKVIAIRKFEHEYPFCYRCETPLIYRAIPAWFVNIQKIKPRVLELNKKLNWYPDFLKEGRFKNSVENAPDWNISRNRYWASAIPIWKCSKCEKIEVLGSIKELKARAIKLPSKNIDLHKDYLDLVKFKCSCGGEMNRIPEVLDCWFESGSMTFAQFHYPFENKEFFEKNFPAQFVVEYIGQVRAWFYYMIVLSAIIFDDIPFENVLTTGTILGEDGEKMSKSKGNFPDPSCIMEKYGVDALRFYLLSTPVMNADSLNFSEKGVEEVYKKVLLLLYNVNNFYSLYKLENVKSLKAGKNIIDRWIVSRLNELIRNSKAHYESYNTVKLCAEIRTFIDDLSTWYVRRNRDRFNENDKDAKQTLALVLIELSKVIAPIMPFAAEIIYHTIVSEKDSVHLQDWPEHDKDKIDLELNKNMALTREIVSKALKERDIAQLTVRQPLAALFVEGPSLDKQFIELIEEEVNVKRVELKKAKKEESEISVKLDTKLTPELEAEGFAREISRKVQSLRKEKGLVKENYIELLIVVGDNLKKLIETQKKLIAERTNAKKIDIASKEPETNKYLANEKDKIKDEKISIYFNKI